MKKVLIILYYWPPAGGPGVQRWLKFVAYLRDFEIEPIVYAPENPNYPLLDKNLTKEIPEVRVIKKPIFEPYSLAGLFSKKDTQTISSGIIQKEKNQTALQKAMLYIRGNYFIPDARKFWIKPSVKFLEDFIEKEQIETIITTGPPHSLHLIGLELKKRLQIKWLADFRDPWTQIGYHKRLKLNKTSKEKHEKLEKSVLNKADHIITTSFTTQKEFQGKTTKPVTLITNGYDAKPNENMTVPDKFRVSHIGSLLSGRNPEKLWAVMKQLTDENKEFASEFELCLAGKVSQEVLNSIAANGLDEYLNVKGYIGHAEAIKLQQNSAVLLLLEIDSEETKGIIAGKLFEYLSAKKPIIAVGPEDWDVQIILTETEAGSSYTYSEDQKLKKRLLELFENYKKGDSEFSGLNLEKYHRKALTAKLAELIKDI